MYDKEGSSSVTNTEYTGSATLSSSTNMTQSYQSCFPCGVNKFVIGDNDNLGGFVDLSKSGNQISLDSVENKYLQSIPGFYGANTTQSNSGRTRCAIGGNNNQFLISVTNGRIAVYDISSFIDLSSHVTI